ncbi:MAG: U32 family peptidase, partial [Akkermansia sp.]|nr:U32 family peptidase [Akkermansia sp.]
MAMLKPEILAPAGNWDCVRAAVANGADAVYFGLDQFNARMRADNFTREDLGTLVPFLHECGVRAYVTMNVLIFPAEMAQAMEYVDALDAAGVDGVIVQDLGLADLIARHRREGRLRIELHISTQMTVSSPEAVRLVDALFDPQQIVLARELSLKEIEACAKATSKPIEVFCHGALCVAYSGQCLTSESLGQRSANRGECAQACRMPYKLEVDGRVRDLGERRYVFSPQDLCALERVPQMLAAGVRSFKIEGRLKSPAYVAATTRAYRRALDAAMAGQNVPPAEQSDSL